MSSNSMVNAFLHDEGITTYFTGELHLVLLQILLHKMQTEYIMLISYIYEYIYLVTYTNIYKNLAP